MTESWWCEGLDPLKYVMELVAMRGMKSAKGRDPDKTTLCISVGGMKGEART